jgi:uncharacterized membrane protein YdjX (TVP38/TMEM64 family)
VTDPAPRLRALRPLLGLVALVVLLGLGGLLRRWLDIEWSAESVRAAVGALGLWAPLAYLVLMVFRQLLALPSMLVLTSGGLLFGAPVGTLLGGVGLALNATLLFATARVMGRDAVLPRLHERWPDLEQRARTAGPPFVAVMTAHPMGVLTPFHFTAGVTGISWPAYLVAVVPAALIRAACYAFLGANLLDPGSPRFWIATAVILGLALLPLLDPRIRRRLRKRDSARSEA